MTVTAIIDNNNNSSNNEELEPVQIERIQQATNGLADILADIFGE